MNLAGKVAIVTGASRGIGKATALALADAGAAVVVAARTEVERSSISGTIHETVAGIVARGGRALAIRTDVGNEDSVSQMVQRTLAEFGRVDMLINNAAAAFLRPLAETPPQRWDAVMNAGLRGVYLCTRAVLPSMMAQRSGSIVNVSSRASDYGEGNYMGAAYCASKAGIERFTSVLAEELAANNIAVNAIKPRAGVLTEGIRVQLPDADPAEWDRPEDFMVKGILFLASQAEAKVTGRVFVDEDLCKQFSLD